MWRDALDSNQIWAIFPSCKWRCFYKAKKYTFDQIRGQRENTDKIFIFLVVLGTWAMFNQIWQLMQWMLLFTRFHVSLPIRALLVFIMYGSPSLLDCFFLLVNEWMREWVSGWKLLFPNKIEKNVVSWFTLLHFKYLFLKCSWASGWIAEEDCRVGQPINRSLSTVQKKIDSFIHLYISIYPYYLY
jgi:hypothetical protein